MVGVHHSIMLVRFRLHSGLSSNMKFDSCISCSMFIIPDAFYVRRAGLGASQEEGYSQNQYD